TAYADGTPFQDGDPIFSAWSPARKLGIRVIQNAPQRQALELDYWSETIGDEWSGGAVRTLDIACALSREASDLAAELILSWLREGRVSVRRSSTGQLSVVPVKAEPILRSRYPADVEKPVPLAVPA